MEKPKTYKMTLDIPQELRDQLESIASREHRSIKGQMMWCLERCVDQAKRASKDEGRKA